MGHNGGFNPFRDRNGEFTTPELSGKPGRQRKGDASFSKATGGGAPAASTLAQAQRQATSAAKADQAAARARTRTKARSTAADGDAASRNVALMQQSVRDQQRELREARNALATATDLKAARERFFFAQAALDQAKLSLEDAQAEQRAARRPDPLAE